MESPLTYQLEGESDHKSGKKRSDNPHLYKAVMWDKGWKNRQKKELENAGEREAASRVMNFRHWIEDQFLSIR